LEQQREELEEVSADATADDLRRAQEIAMRAAAFDSGAIEGLYPTDRGLTLTVATQAIAWEQEVDERSEDARALFESQLSAFELVLDLVAERFPKITQAWIRRLHEEITAAQDSYVVQTPAGPQDQVLPRGKYKEHPNHVRTRDGQVHAYAPVDQTQSEMHRLLEELDSHEFTNAHPVLQASYAHYAFVSVHPFADGNGRVARALASAYTYRSMSVPLLVQAHQRDMYFGALADADSGTASSFIEFTSTVVRNAVELVTETLKTAQAPQPEEVLEALRDLFVVHGELSHQQLDRIANEFVDGAFVGIANEQRNALTLPDGISIDVIPSSGGTQSQPPDGFRSVVHSGPRSVELKFASMPPGEATHRENADVFVATGPDSDAVLLLRSVGRPDEKLGMSLLDLQPQLSSAARHRLSSFVRRQMGTGLDVLHAKAKESLRRTGY
jgi:Fic family protein